MATRHGDPARWAATDGELKSLPVAFKVEEDSSCCLRILAGMTGCLNLRALKLHWLENGAERYRAERPCRLGCVCCCNLEVS